MACILWDTEYASNIIQKVNNRYHIKSYKLCLRYVIIGAVFVIVILVPLSTIEWD